MCVKQFIRMFLSPFGFGLVGFDCINSLIIAKLLIYNTISKDRSDYISYHIKKKNDIFGNNMKRKSKNRILNL